MAELEAAGFDVPRWIASNSADAVRAFTSECRGQAIYKASSGLRSRVRRVDPQLIERLYAGTTPTVVQEYVHGTDVRVHTVERHAFACEVASEESTIALRTRARAMRVARSPTHWPSSAARSPRRLVSSTRGLISGAHRAADIAVSR
jgi:hypothetical protein